MKTPRLVLFAGMGGDPRMFGPIRLSHGELVAPEHVEPVGPEAVAALQAMAADCPPLRLRRFGEMIARWPGASADLSAFLAAL